MAGGTCRSRLGSPAGSLVTSCYHCSKIRESDELSSVQENRVHKEELLVCRDYTL